MEYFSTLCKDNKNTYYLHEKKIDKLEYKLTFYELQNDNKKRDAIIL